LAHTQRLDTLGQLAGGIAHDLTNLLALMSGNLQLLQIEYPKTPRARRLIGSVLHSVGRGTALTGKLVSLARHQRLALQPLDLKTALHAVEQMLGRTLGGDVRVHLAVCR
jgi:signal transduction histidine kinase